MSNPHAVGDIAQVVDALGGFHDARLSGLRWDGVRRELEVDVDDIYSNSEGMPGYQGPRKGTLQFHAVTRFDADVPLAETGLLVYECTLRRRDAGGWAGAFAFSPGGRIIVECDMVELTEV